MKCPLSRSLHGAGIRRENVSAATLLRVVGVVQEIEQDDVIMVVDYLR